MQPASASLSRSLSSRTARSSLPGKPAATSRARYNRDGSLDPSFGSGGKVLTDFGGFMHEEVLAVAVEPDGKIVAAGLSTPFATARDFDFALARYNHDGSLDPSFGSGGKLLTDVGSWSGAAGVALEPNGRIVAAGGSGGDFALARYNGDGSLDPSFGSGGKALTDFGGLLDGGNALTIEPNGKIVVAGISDVGGSIDFALARYGRDGSLDASFGSGGTVLTDFGGQDRGNALATDPNGKIVVAGASLAGANEDFALAPLRPRRKPRSGFGSGGKVLTDFGSGSFASAHGVALQPDGKIVAAGDSRGFALARYLAR